MSNDVQHTNEPSISTLEDFGRCSPGEMLDSNPNTTDQSFLDEAYREENACA